MLSRLPRSTHYLVHRNARPLSRSIFGPGKEFSSQPRHWRDQSPKPLSPIARLSLAAAASVVALRNPHRADLVGIVSEATAGRALTALTERVAASPTGGPMLSSRCPPRFPGPGVDAGVLRSMPEKSLGWEYGRFMERRGFEIGGRGRTEVRHGLLVEDEGEAWVLQRVRDVHDLWHVVCDVPTSLMGEVALKWFEAVVTNGVGVSLGAVGGLGRLKTEDRWAVLTELVPWAFEAGANLKVDLVCVRYEDYLEKNLEEVREEWGVITPRQFMVDPEALYRRKRRSHGS